MNKYPDEMTFSDSVNDMDLGSYIVPIAAILIILVLIASVFGLCDKTDEDCVIRNMDKIAEFSKTCNEAGLLDCKSMAYKKFNCIKE